MLSTKLGVPIAKVTDGTFVYLNSDDQKVQDKFSTDFRKKINKELKKSELKKLVKHLQLQQPPDDKKLNKYYIDGLNDIQDDTLTNCIILKDRKKLMQYPRLDLVERMYIAGVSGSGKSTYTGKYLKFWKKENKDSEIFVYSSVDEDTAFDWLDPIRVDVNDYPENQFNVKQDLQDTLNIFDDIDTLPINIRKPIDHLKSHILETGRHYNAAIIVTSHMISNYKSTRQVLNEATSVTLFPKASGSYHINKYLQSHMGFTKLQQERFHNLDSRWVTLFRSYPSYIIWEKGICIASKF